MKQSLPRISKFIYLTLRTLFLLLLALVFALTLPAQSAWAFSSQASDDAFAALLSMPGAKPSQGYWKFDLPDDFSPGTEAQLIRYLARKKKAGADFNAYRHFGTLLHHAIRADKIQTAIWLLANGANPNLILKDSNANALDLSIGYQRKKLVTFLTSKYGMQPKPPPPAPLKADLQEIDHFKPGDNPNTDVPRAREVLNRIVLLSNMPRPGNEDDVIRKKWLAINARLSPTLLAKVFDDDDTLGNLMTLYRFDAKSLEHALSNLPAPLLQQHQHLLLQRLAQSSGLSRNRDNQLTYNVPAEVWRSLWRHLKAPLDYAKVPDLAGKIAPELWPQLFASGYRNHHAQSALACLPTEITAADLRTLWPRLKTWFPNIEQTIAAMVLKPWQMFKNDDCQNGASNEIKDKLLFLSSLGIQSKVNGLNLADLENEPPEMRAALAPFIAPPQTSPAQITDASAACHFDLNPLWYAELSKHAVLGIGLDPSSLVHIETAQLLEIPGEPECALLLGGEQRLDPYIPLLFDSFTGPMRDPTPSCPDPTDQYEIWQHKNGKIIRLKAELGGEYEPASLSLVQYGDKQARYYLNQGKSAYGCNSIEHAPFLLQWQKVAGVWALLRVEQAPALEQAILAQCTLEEGQKRCRGIAALSVPSAAPPDSGESKRVATLADAWQGMAYTNFIQAFSAARPPGVPVLKAFEPPRPASHRLRVALEQLDAAKLPVKTKRQRIKALFADQKQLAQALHDPLLLRLLAWLPPADWPPILSAIENYKPLGFDFIGLRKSIAAKGFTELACEVDHIQGLICGETWGEGQAPSD